MSAATPILPGAAILVEAEESDNPKTVLNAFLVQGEGEAETWQAVGSSTYDEDDWRANQVQFLWAMSSLASFHNITFQNDSRIDQ